MIRYFIDNWDKIRASNLNLPASSNSDKNTIFLISHSNIQSLKCYEFITLVREKKV